METIDLEIIGWEKHQASRRKDVKHPAWFKMKHDLCTSPKLFGLTSEQKWLFVCLLCCASQKNSKTLSAPVGWFTSVSGVSEKNLKKSIDALARNGLVTYTARGRNAHVPSIRQEEKRREENREEENNIYLPSNPTGSSGQPSLESYFLNRKDFLLGLYTEDYLRSESLKMSLWLKDNKHKHPKSERGMGRFVSGWLERGWERYRKTLPSNQADLTDWGKVFGENEKEVVENGS